MADVPSHHLIHGLATDFLTGGTVVDTDDERIRQKIARLLVAERGFATTDIEPRRTIETLFGDCFVVSTIDFVVSVEGRRCLALRYGPGSLVTRERAAVAAARVLDPEGMIPFAVVTNGTDAELLDTATGTVMATGLDAIPSRDRAVAMSREAGVLPPPDPAARERELRILNAFDVEICCAGGPCALPCATRG